MVLLFWRQTKWRKRLFVSVSFVAVLTLATACSIRSETSQLRLGVWAAEHDLWDEAIFRWQKALEKDPNSAVLHNNLAVAYEKKGLWDKARAEYELALQLAPDNRYIKANYRYFEENLKAREKTEKPEDKKIGQKEAKIKLSSQPQAKNAGLKDGDKLKDPLAQVNKRAQHGKT